VIPLLGAGVNRCGRPSGSDWGKGKFLPDGVELARYLANYAGYPEEDPRDLVRVSQYFAVMVGAGALYDELRELFDVDYPPTAVHQFLASVPSELRRQDIKAQHQLIITTNYDDALERAFQDAGEPFDLITYITVGDDAGYFMLRAHEGDESVIKVPNEYLGVSLDRRTVILKIHGAVDRHNAEHDSYVITEDHYIDYLTRTDITSRLPTTLAAKLQRSHFLFLGYSMRDWNLRVILHRIWGDQRLKYKSWAIQLNPEEIDQKFWGARDVDILDVPLEDYMTALSERVAALPAVGAPA
jgi:hypothetical protein